MWGTKDGAVGIVGRQDEAALAESGRGGRDSNPVLCASRSQSAAVGTSPRRQSSRWTGRREGNALSRGLQQRLDRTLWPTTAAEGGARRGALQSSVNKLQFLTDFRPRYRPVLSVSVRFNPVGTGRKRRMGAAGVERRGEGLSSHAARPVALSLATTSAEALLAC